MELNPWQKSLMSMRDRPELPGEKFRIRAVGQWHTVGDINCPGCGVLDGIRYPHPHQGKEIKHQEFLVHGEAIAGVFAQCCEGGCCIPPIPFAPKLPPKRSI